jgi:transcriptional regulator with XRE-family HTH domain
LKINIGKIRTEKRISTRKLVKLTGIKKSRIGDIENPKKGKSPVNVIELEAIAKALGVRITELFESEYK